MSDHETSFDRAAEVSLGAPVRFKGNVFPKADGEPSVGQLIIDTGAASIVLYPSPLTLDELADDLRAFAAAVRAERPS